MLTFFFAAFAFCLVFAALAFGSGFLLAALALSGGFLFAALAFTLAFGFLVAGAVFGADAVLAVGSKACAVGASHLAMMHASLVNLLHIAGVLSGGVFGCGIAVAGNHSDSESDSEESGH